jgi:type II pantothenate kinase
VARAADTLGIDVGATLAKLALAGDPARTEHLPSADLGAVRARIATLGAARIAATGGGAPELATALDGTPVVQVPEFDAWARGVGIVATAEAIPLPQRYMLVSIGTGTSVLLVEDGGAVRAGGTGIGGGTLLGLARLLLRVDSFAEVSALAASGDRRAVDLLVGDVYRHGPSPLPAELTAANFAKLASTRPADVAHALMGLVGESVALVCRGVASAAGVATAVYCGSTLEGNPALRRVLEETSTFAGLEARFLARGAYCGAIGAAACAGVA